MLLKDDLPAVAVPPPGPRSRELLARLGAVECPAFAPRRAARAGASGADPSGIVLSRGRGANVWDADENRYVDLAAGFGACVLGHGPSPAHAAAARQIDALVQGLGDLYATEIKVLLLERLAALYGSPGARVLLGQSGADAVTIALKTAVLATGKPGVLAFEASYHGLSYAPLAACGFAPSFREPFAAQLGDHVTFAPYPRAIAELDRCLEAARTALRRGDVGAVLFEPILGRGGVVVPPPAFVPALLDLAREHGALSIADEIWTGMGRSGGVTSASGADLVCLGKGLGAGFPISACIGGADAMQGWARGGSVVHTSTHAGAPLGCAAALATLDAVDGGALAARARRLGADLSAAIERELAAADGFVGVRGAGLMIGVELEGDRGAAALRGLLERGYLATAGGRGAETIVLTPPLTIHEAALASVVPALRDAVAEAV